MSSRMEQILTALVSGEIVDFIPMTRNEVLLKQLINKGGGTGGGATPDWNAAEGEPGHVKNRTHWSEVVKSEWLPETVCEFNDENESTVLLGEKTITEGHTYKVTWNGIEYICVAEFVPALAIVAFGNMSYFDENLMGYTEPFAVAIADGQALLMTFESVPLTATVSIEEINETVYPIPDKYIDKDFRITVTASGDTASHTIDKTFEEILAAYRSGKNITLLFKGLQNTFLYYLTEPMGNGFGFATLCDMDSNLYARYAKITSDGKFKAGHIEVGSIEYV